MVARQYLSGDGFYRGLVTACRHLESKKEAINELNVFPVPDGDTGTNMALTMQAAVREMHMLQGRRSLGHMARAAAKGSLLGARGNSGVILSQFLRGWAVHLEGRAVATSSDLAAAFERAVASAYAAVMEPVEGTMLSVGRAAAQAARQAADSDHSLRAVLVAALAGARQALANTPNELEALRKAGVVDAGGHGLVMILEGCVAALDDPLDRFRTLDEQLSEPRASGQTELTPTGRPPARRGESVLPQRLQHVRMAGADGAAAPHPQGIKLADIEFKYCTEFILTGDKLPQEALRRSLQPLGDSLLVVGDDEVLKIHVHTNHPGRALELAVAYGDLSSVQVTNMQAQNEAAARENDSLALSSTAEQRTGDGDASSSRRQATRPAMVAVVPGAGFADIFRSLGTEAIVYGGQTMNPSTQEIVEAIEAAGGNPVFVFPNNKNVMFAARQAVSLTHKAVHVIPSLSVPHGIAAAMAFRPPDDGAENRPLASLAREMEEAMASVRSGEVTRAVRDAQVDGFEVAAGQYMGLLAGKVCCIGHEREDVAAELASRLLGEGGDLLTIYYGADVRPAAAQALAERVRVRHEHGEIEIYAGGQPHYPYVLSVE